MSKIIKAIDKEAVHRICSGQVVLNLATAVKELVENSLDAGATSVEVRLCDYGSDLIEVSDNGCGVLPDNFEGLTAKHHTSKLQDFSDLVNVETFGFRGEALSSLCALSDVTVVTRHESEPKGSKLVLDHHGKITSITPTFRQVGTTVTVEKLFKSLPVRQKEFHRNLKREYLKMVQLLNAYGLISTNVRLTCVNQPKKGARSVIMSTHGCKTVRDNIACIFGAKQLNSLLDVKKVLPDSETLSDLKLKEEDADKFELEGLISSCAHGQGRSSGDRQFFFINNRPCEPAKIVKCVNEVYHSYNLHQMPFVFLNVTAARNSVDVNVTPDKRQIFLDHEKLLVATIKASLMSLYEKIPSTYQVNNVFSVDSSSAADSAADASSDSQTSEVKPAYSLTALLDKWKHGKNKGQAEAPSNKRKNENSTSTSAKQLKLDDTFHVTSIVSNSQESIHSASLSAAVETSTSSQNVTNQLSQSSTCSSLSGQSFGLIASQESRASQNSLESSLSIEIFDASSLKIDSLDECEKFSNKEEEPKNEASRLSGEKVYEADSKDSDPSKLLIRSSCSIENIAATHRESEGSKLVEEEIEPKGSEPEGNEPEVIVYDSTPKDEGSRKTVVVKDVSVRTIREALEQFRLEEEKDAEKSVTNRFHATIDPSKNTLAENELNREITKDMFAKMEIVGQFNLGFIVVQLGSDLFIVDQHATDEKYNFETLQLKTTLSNQKLVSPQVLELTAANESVLIDNIDIFRKNGFEFSIDESGEPLKRVKLTAIPMSQNWQFGKDDIDELLFMLQDSPGTMCRPSRVRAMFASRACRMSVMIGTALNVTEMKRLVVHMGEIEQPWNCPHGRPTMRHLINLSLLR